MARVEARDKHDVLKLVKENDIKFIRFWFTDIQGMLKSFAITREELEGALDEGMGFDGSSITGYQDIEESDMIAMPDPATFRILPFRPKEHGVARMICDVLQPGGKSYEGDPRQVLRKMIERTKKMGFDHFYVGPELEYFYFKAFDATQVLDYGSYFDLTPLDVASDIRRDTILDLEQLGIDVEYSHHEVGPSQHEIDMRYKDALTMADNCLTFRLVVKEVAAQHGVYATFMPKPMFGQAGSGMHTHQSLFRGDRNAFFDANDPYHLSKEAKAYMAGLLHHAPEMTAVLAQWVNSYKRLVPGYEAPVYIAWSQRNRSALVRVPYYKPGKEVATRIELRCPDPACNPYLAFTAMLAAGLKGIQDNYALPAPMDKNLYHLTPEEREEAGIHALPSTLGEALEHFEKSELMRDALGDHVFHRFVNLKKAEFDEYRIQVTEYELKKYLPIL